jgi:hypothetical protein
MDEGSKPCVPVAEPWDVRDTLVIIYFQWLPDNQSTRRTTTMSYINELSVQATVRLEIVLTLLNTSRAAILHYVN